MNFSLLPFITPGRTGEEAPPTPPQPPPQPQPADSVNSKPLLHPAIAFVLAPLCAVGILTPAVQLALICSS